MAGTFSKQTTGTPAPAGTIKFTSGNFGPWVFDDGANATKTGLTAAEMTALRSDHINGGTKWLKEA